MEERMEELARNFIKHRGVILGVIDHKLMWLDKCTLITTSAWRNECNVEGVGILVTNKLEKLIADIKPHNKTNQHQLKPRDINNNKLCTYQMVVRKLSLCDGKAADPEDLPPDVIKGVTLTKLTSILQINC